jgi:GTP-binding protein EngB required for normal cell division
MEGNPNPDNNLFEVLEKGDFNISKAKPKAIILLGLTRAGKSTVFNWILNKPLLGTGRTNT